MRSKNYWILLSLLVVHTQICLAQDRGLKPVEVKIEGQPTTLYKQSHALIIGVYDYNNGWRPLPGVKTDIAEVKKALEATGFHVELSENGTKEQINKAITDFIYKYGQEVDNRVLIYFAGHGHTVKTAYDDNLGYIVPVNAPNPGTDLPGFQAMAIEMKAIEIYAYSIQSKHAIFLFDACFAGSLFDMRSAVSEAITQKTTRFVRQFITSGGADEKVPDESIFRKEFITAITSDEADYDKDGFLTGSELGFYLQNKVESYSGNTQHPQFGKIRNPKLDKGDFVFRLPEKGENEAKAPSPASSETNPQQPEKKPAQQQVNQPKGNEYEEFRFQKPDANQPTEHAEASRGTGHLEVTTEFAGDLWINNSFRQRAMAGGIVLIRNLAPGRYQVELKGNNNWKDSVTIESDKMAFIKISKARLEKTGAFTIPVAGMEIQMCGIPGGKFMFGQKEGDPGLEKEVPAFSMMRYEVSVSEFKQFIEATGYKTDAERHSGGFGSVVLVGNSPENRDGITWKCGSDGFLRSQSTYNHPVIHVSWNDAVAYAAWLSEKTGMNWRLPDEVEWEYAARGGENFRFSGSDSVDVVAWHWKNSNRATQPPGLKKPNLFGLYDMSGNVREWCLEQVKAEVADPSKGESFSIWCPARGGSSDMMPSFCEVTSRSTYPQEYRNHSTGFRLVLEP
jgi:formylglycine-generating enzyme required for sulfatase activity